MADRVLKCDKCGGESFTEYSVEECSQRGVMVRDTGDGGVELDYDYADTIELSGCTSRHMGLVCEKCGAEYMVTCLGKLESLNTPCVEDRHLAERTAP